MVTKEYHRNYYWTKAGFRDKKIKKCRLWRKNNPGYWKKYEENRKKKNINLCPMCNIKIYRTAKYCRQHCLSGKYKRTEDNRLQSSIRQRGKKRPYFSGVNHPNWQGGKSQYLNNYVKKRREIMLRLGYLSKKTIQMVYEDNIKKYGTLTCIYCIQPIDFGNDTLEHKLPISRNGTNEYNNLAIACHHCNVEKHDKTEQKYIEWRNENVYKAQPASARPEYN